MVTWAVTGAVTSQVTVRESRDTSSLEPPLSSLESRLESEGWQDRGANRVINVI